jgi:hypothetical protein
VRRVWTLILVTLLAAPVVNTSVVAYAAHRHHHHRCEGKRATIVGTRKHNTLIGTNHADVIWAGRGNDYVLGRGGVDIICGGQGSDDLDGNVGLDHINGGRGYDWCVATRKYEHMHNHRSCEVHELTKGRKPHKKPSARAVAKAAPRFVQDVGTRASQCGSQCSPGRPVCGGDYSSQIDWHNPATLPQGTITNNGYLAIAYQFWVPRPGSATGWDITYTSNWAYTGHLGPGTYDLQPIPATTGALNGPGTPDRGYVMVWFAYSPTGASGSWSFSYAVSTSYIYRVAEFDISVPTNECSV